MVYQYEIKSRYELNSATLLQQVQLPILYVILVDMPLLGWITEQDVYRYTLLSLLAAVNGLVQQEEATKVYTACCICTNTSTVVSTTRGGPTLPSAFLKCGS